MPDYFDFALPSTPGIRRTADFESAMSLSPMVGQLMELRERSQRLRSNDLRYRMADYEFGQRQREQDEYDSFSDDIKLIREETDGDPGLFASRVIDRSMDDPGNERIQKAREILLGSFKDRNAYREDMLKSSALDLDESTREDREQTIRNNVAAGLIESEERQRKAKERETMNSLDVSKSLSVFAQKLLGDDPDSAMAINTLRTKLSNNGDDDLIKIVADIGDIFPSEASYRLVNSEEYEWAKKFNGILSENGVDPTTFGTPDFDAQIEAAIGRRPPDERAGFAAMVDRWKVIAGNKMNYDKAREKIALLASEIPDKSDTKAYEDWVVRLNNLHMVSSAMASEQNDQIKIQADRIKQADRAMEIQEKVLRMENTKNLMNNRNAIRELAKLRLLYSRSESDKRAFRNAIEIKLKLDEGSLDLNDPEDMAQVDAIMRKIDNAASGERVDVLE